MNSILLVESIEVEFNAIYESCDNAIAYATARFMEEKRLFPRYFMEADEEKKTSGGLLGFIKNIFKAIGDMLSKAGAKVKSILFGSEVDHSKDNEKVNGKDGNAVENFMNNTFKSGKDLLSKAAKGELSVEDAQKFKDDCTAKAGAIGTVATSLAGMFGITKVSQKYMNKWNDELDALYKSVETEVENLETGETTMKVASTVAEEKLAKSSSKENKDAIIKQTTTIILSAMQTSTKFGLGCIEDNIKTMYAKNYIRNKLVKGEQTFTDPKALKAARKEANANVKANEKKVKDLEKETREIARASEDRDRMDKAQQKSNAKLNQALNNRYNDQDNYVNPDDLNNDDYDAYHYKTRRKKEERKAAMSNVASGIGQKFSKLRKRTQKPAKKETPQNNGETPETDESQN